MAGASRPSSEPPPSQVHDEGIRIGDRRLGAGEIITIDGGTGEVFAGAVGGATKVVPEAATLLAWARELGIAIGDEAMPATPEPSAGSEAATTPSPSTATEATVGSAGVRADDLLSVLLVKGYTTAEGVAAALLIAPDDAAQALDRLVADGLAEIAAGSFRLTADGKAVAPREGRCRRGRLGTR